MPALDAAAILAVWERGSAQSLGERALTLLEFCGLARAEAACLAVGERDAELLRIRRRLFGDRIDAIATCAVCGEKLEVTLSASALIRECGGSQGDVVITGAQGVPLHFRVPNAGDLAALRDVDDVESGVALLIERCKAFPSDGAERADAALSADVIAALEDALCAADPGAELLLASRCPACGGDPQVLFDMPSFLWRETTALAREMLWDVHELALAYGWSEDAILRLSPARRQFYLSVLQR